MSLVTELVAAGVQFVDLPNPDPAPVPGAEAPATMAISWLKWGALIAAIVGLLALATIMALNHRRGEGATHIGSLGWIIFAIVIASAATFIVTAIAGV